MKAILSALAVLASLPVLGGYLGALHPLGDSLAVFRLQAAGLLAVMSAFALMAGAVRWGRIGMLMGLLAGGVPVVWAYGTTPAPGGDLRLYQKNMLYRNDALPDLAADIRAAAPDAVTLQEVSQANLALLNDLAPDFPHQLRCDEPGAGGGAVLTRLMPVPGGEFCAPGLAAMQVQGPKGPLWLVSIHLRWPWPHNQAAQVQALLPVLEELQGPVVMAGDFNMVRWSWAFSALTATARTKAAGPVFGSYTGFAPWLVLPIDHVTAPGGGRVMARDGLGSDHLGLLADLAL